MLYLPFCANNITALATGGNKEIYRSGITYQSVEEEKEELNTAAILEEQIEEY